MIGPTTAAFMRSLARGIDEGPAAQRIGGGYPGRECEVCWLPLSRSDLMNLCSDHAPRDEGDE